MRVLRLLAFGALGLALAARAVGADADGLDEAALLLGQGRLEQALARLHGAAPSPEDAQRSDLLEGLLLHRLKRDDEAVAPLLRALAREPGEFEARLDLGQAYQASGRWDLAKEEFDRLVHSFPDKAEPWSGLGEIAAGQGRQEEARRCFQRAVDLGPGLIGPRLGLSDCLLKLGLLRLSAASRQSAIDLGAGDPDLWFKQAVAWYGLGELDLSEAALRQAALGDRPEAFFLSGCLQYRRGHLGAAERDFLAALGAKADYPQARLDLGITYYGQERYDEALAQFDLLLAREDGQDAAAYRGAASAAASDHYFQLGSQALIQGDLVGALEPLQRAEALAPTKDRPSIHALIARVRKREGPQAEALVLQAGQALKDQGLPQAVLLWQKALRLDPGNAGALKGLDSVKGDLGALSSAYAKAALAADEGGDRAGAQALVERLRQVDGQAARALVLDLQALRQRRSQALLAAGMAALAKEQPRQALEQFDRALLLDPGDPRALARRAQAKEALSQRVNAFLALAAEAEAQGQWTAAYQGMEKALAADPADLEAREGRRRLGKRLDLKRDDALQADGLYYQGVYAYGAGDTTKALALWHEGLRLDPGHRPLTEAVRSADLKVKALASLAGP